MKLFSKDPAHEGVRDTVEFRTWRSMLRRCYDIDHTGYENWGGRGITVCPEWRDDFFAFVNHVGLRPGTDFSIDRIDVESNYEPGNVEWSSSKTQSLRKRTTRYETLNGVTKTVAEWAKGAGIPLSVVHSRMGQGWTFARALATPVRARKKKASTSVIRTTGPLSLNGVARNAREWARLIGVSENVISARRRMGWSVEDILTKPVGKQGPKMPSQPTV